jgi:hypothetical protein
MIALFFFGLGSMLLFSLATTMLTEFMPGKSSAGVAVSPESSTKLSTGTGSDVMVASSTI